MRVYIGTNNNKVWRIMVCDANTCDETNIKIRFNNLCDQFAKNKKYTPTNMGVEDFKIPEDEDISYEMAVHNKRYDASFYQALDTDLIDTLATQQRLRDVLLQEFTQNQIENPTEKQAEKMQEMAQKETVNIVLDLMEKKLVWFLISEEYGEYSITMFYDNEYNHSNGEDL